VLYWHSPQSYAIRRGDWKLIHHGQDLREGSDELYNIAQDPYEKKELAGVMSEKVAELKRELAAQAQIDKPAL